MDKRATFLLFAATTLLSVAALSGCNKAPEASVTAPAAPSVSANVADIDVTEHVKTALQQSDALKGFDIGVVTLKGDVRLNGMVDTQAQIDEALRIAGAAEGAHTVHDELTIKK